MRPYMARRFEEIDEPDEDGHDGELRAEELFDARLLLNDGEGKTLFGPRYGLDVRGLLHSSEHLDRLVVASFLAKETDRFGQKVAEKGNKKEGQEREKENDPPPVGGDKQHRDYPGDGGPYHKAGEHGCDHPRPDSGRREFGREGDIERKGAAHADACQKTEDTEGLEIVDPVESAVKC